MKMTRVTRAVCGTQHTKSVVGSARELLGLVNLGVSIEGRPNPHGLTSSGLVSLISSEKDRTTVSIRVQKHSMRP